MLGFRTKSSFKNKFASSNATAVIFVVFTLLLSSCLRTAKDPIDDGGEIRDFRVLKISGEITDGKTVDKSNEKISDKNEISKLEKNNLWTIPTEKRYTLTACLIGRNTNQQLPQGQEFMIIGHDGSAIKEKTDDRGCLIWEEVIKFNFTSNSIYLKKTRRLKSIGSYKGEAEIAVAINPWMSYRNEPGDDVIDIERSDAANGLMIDETDEELLRLGFLNRDKESASLLIDPDLNLNISHVKYIKGGKTLQLNFNVKPYIEPKNLRGEPVRFDLTTGRYRVFAQLVSTNVGLKANEHAILTNNILSKPVDVTTSGLLIINTEFDLKREITMGSVRLALKIKPMDTPYPIYAYEGLHQVNNFRKIEGNHKGPQTEGKLSTGKAFNYAEFIKKSTNFEKLKNIEVDGKKLEIAQDMTGVYFDPFYPTFIRIAPGETATQRTLMYRITVIVRDRITGEPVPNEAFRIKKLFTNSEVVQNTLADGRLIWEDEIHHLYYKPEQYFFPEFEITQIISGEKFSNKIAVNPWDFGWTFGYDIRGSESYYAGLAKKKVSSPQFMIDAFRYQTVRFRYVIDEFLTLNVKKAVVMALDPLVEKNTILEGRKFEPLRNGIYLVKIALVKYYLDPFQNNTKLVKVGKNYVDESVSCEGFDRKDEELIDPIKKSEDYPVHIVNEETEDELNENLIFGSRRRNKKAETKKPEKEDAAYSLETVRCNGDAREGQYTTVIKKLLRVQAGRITTPLEFSMRDLRMMSIRSNIMIQLETIDETKLLADNLANEKINQMIKDYYNINNSDLSEEDRDALIEEKIALYNLESEKLKLSMDKNLKEVQGDRNNLNQAFLERDKKLTNLNEELRNKALLENSQTYKENINKPEDEFLEKMNEARASLNQIHSEIESYWSNYEKAWVEDQLEGYGEGDNQPILLSTPIEQVSKKPSYYDYLASMQTFLKDFGAGLNVLESDLESLKRNEYSDTPLTPLVDLNFYIEESGLRKRTFIGPCTLVENDNMSELRPTDKIDEADGDTIDNSQLVYEPLTPPADNREFERSAYHDSLVPFADSHVDDIIAIHIRNEKQYEIEMKALSQLGRYVRSFNLEYVSLKDKPLREYKNGCDLNSDEDCFPAQKENVMSSGTFLSQLNKQDLPQLLARYFYVRPSSYSKELNEAIVRDNSLEPVWDKALRKIYEFLPKTENRWLNTLFDPTRSRSSSDKYHSSAEDYLKGLSSNTNIQADHSTVERWLDLGPHNLNLIDGVKICAALASQITSRLNAKNLIDNSKSSLSGRSKTTHEYLLEYCFSKIHHIDKETIESNVLLLNSQISKGNMASDRVYINGIDFDRRRKVHRTGRYEHKAGKNTNLNVGIGFDIGSYQDSNTVSTLGLNAGALLGLPAVGAGAWASSLAAKATLAKGVAAAGAAAVAAPIAGVAIAGAVGVVGAFLVAMPQANTASGVNMTTGTSVSMSTFLVIQKAEMDIDLLEYEKCLSFKFSPEAINDLDLKRLHLNDGVNSKNQDLKESLERGYLICGGHTDNPPVKVRENYYYITQHFTAGDMLDEANLLNHVWLLALRGERDFNSLIKTMIGREVGNDGEFTKKDRLYDYSLSRLSTIYGKVFPSFPGMYSVQDPIPIHTQSAPRFNGF